MKRIIAAALFFLLTTAFLTGTGLTIPMSEIDIGWFRESPVEPLWGTDPFVPKVRVIQDQVVPPAGEKSFVLTAVLLGGENPTAILNGSVVKVGDNISDHKVTRITRKSIFLKGPTGTTEIPLKALFSFEGQKP